MSLIPKTTEESHKRDISAEDFIYELTQLCLDKKLTVERGISYLVREKLKNLTKSIYIGGSSFTKLNNNPIDFLISTILKVNYGNNENLIIGTAYHDAIAYAYNSIKDSNTLPSLSKCYRELIRSVRKGYKYIRAEVAEQYTQKDLVREAARLFVVYYNENLQEAKNIYLVEELLALKTPSDMYKMKEMFTKIDSFDTSIEGETFKNLLDKLILAGTPDLVQYDPITGVITITDHKSSKLPIKGKVTKNPKLEEYDKELTSLNSEITSCEKTMAKHEKAFSKLKDLFVEKQTKLLAKENALSNKKPTTAIQKSINRIARDIHKYATNYKTYLETQSVLKELKEQKDEILALRKSYDIEYRLQQEKADLIECINKHSFQNSFYATLLLITHGHKFPKLGKIKLRIENIVKAQKPYIQNFEWELNEYQLDRAGDMFQNTVNLLELLFSGLIDPMVLFRRAEQSFIGDDSNKLIDEVSKLLLEENLIK